MNKSYVGVITTCNQLQSDLVPELVEYYREKYNGLNVSEEFLQSEAKELAEYIAYDTVFDMLYEY